MTAVFHTTSQNLTAASGLLPARIPGDYRAAGSRTAIDKGRNWRQLSQKKNHDQPSHQCGPRRAYAQPDHMGPDPMDSNMQPKLIDNIGVHSNDLSITPSTYTMDFATGSFYQCSCIPESNSPILSQVGLHRRRAGVQAERGNDGVIASEVNAIEGTLPGTNHGL
jgi:hypothetical protein